MLHVQLCIHFGCTINSFAVAGEYVFLNMKYTGQAAVVWFDWQLTSWITVTSL